jgi:hypothetical protein
MSDSWLHLVDRALDVRGQLLAQRAQHLLEVRALARAHVILALSRDVGRELLAQRFDRHLEYLLRPSIKNGA